MCIKCGIIPVTEVSTQIAYLQPFKRSILNLHCVLRQLYFNRLRKLQIARNTDRVARSVKIYAKNLQ